MNNLTIATPQIQHDYQQLKIKLDKGIITLKEEREYWQLKEFLTPNNKKLTIDFTCEQCGDVQKVPFTQEQFDNYPNENNKLWRKTTPTPCCDNQWRRFPSYKIIDIDPSPGIMVCHTYGFYYWNIEVENSPWMKISKEWYDQLIAYTNNKEK